MSRRFVTSLRIFLTSLAEVLTLACVKSFYRTRYFEKQVISCATVRKLGGIILIMAETLENL